MTNELRPAQDSKPAAAAVRKPATGPNKAVVKPEQKPVPAKKVDVKPSAPKAPTAKASVDASATDKHTVEAEAAAKPKAKIEPRLCPHYRTAVFATLKKAENREELRPKNIFEEQQEVTARMRGILLDWLVEVHYKFKLSPETLFLCINLVDRVLAKDKKVHRKQLQLVGGTCMLIASKYEDFRPPEIADFTYIMDSAYTRDEIIAMELRILELLRWQVTVPSPLQFLDHYIQAAGVSREEPLFFIAQYLIELTAMELKFQGMAPSLLAAAALYLANRIKKKPQPWPTALAECTGFKELEEVKPLARSIFDSVPDYRTTKSALFKKYSLDKYKAVAPDIPLH